MSVTNKSGFELLLLVVCMVSFVGCEAPSTQVSNGENPSGNRNENEHNSTQEEYEDQGLDPDKKINTLGLSQTQLITLSEAVLKSRSIKPEFETKTDENSDKRAVLEKTTGIFIHSVGPKQDLSSVGIAVLYEQFMKQTVEGQQTQQHFMALSESVGRAVAPGAKVDFTSQINKLASRGVADIKLSKTVGAKLMLQQNTKGKKVIVFLVSNLATSK